MRIEADIISLFNLNTSTSLFSFYLLIIMTHATGLRKFLGKIRSPIAV